MITTPNLSLFNCNTLELHYGFKDNTHTMDAFVQNNVSVSSWPFKRIATTFNAEIIIETEPFGEGDLDDGLKLQ